MRAMVLFRTRNALSETELPKPQPSPGEVLVRVDACAVCRTDLHAVDGDLPDPKLPLVPGHQIVGRVAAAGANAQRFKAGDRVGIPWLAWTCGSCEYCRSGKENLCDSAQSLVSGPLPFSLRRSLCIKAATFMCSHAPRKIGNSPRRSALGGLEIPQILLPINWTPQSSLRLPEN